MRRPLNRSFSCHGAPRCLKGSSNSSEGNTSNNAPRDASVRVVRPPSDVGLPVDSPLVDVGGVRRSPRLGQCRVGRELPPPRRSGGGRQRQHQRRPKNSTRLAAGCGCHRHYGLDFGQSRRAAHLPRSEGTGASRSRSRRRRRGWQGSYRCRCRRQARSAPDTAHLRDVSHPQDGPDDAVRLPRHAVPRREGSGIRSGRRRRALRGGPALSSAQVLADVESAPATGVCRGRTEAWRCCSSWSGSPPTATVAGHYPSSGRTCHWWCLLCPPKAVGRDRGRGGTWTRLPSCQGTAFGRCDAAQVWRRGRRAGHQPRWERGASGQPVPTPAVGWGQGHPCQLHRDAPGDGAGGARHGRPPSWRQRPPSRRRQRPRPRAPPRAGQALGAAEVGKRLQPRLGWQHDVEYHRVCPFAAGVDGSSAGCSVRFAERVRRLRSDGAFFCFGLDVRVCVLAIM